VDYFLPERHYEGKAAEREVLHISVKSVRAKVAGELTNSVDKGCCICYFEAAEELYYWTYDELRAIVGT